jgi:hypothetical protein
MAPPASARVFADGTGPIYPVVEAAMSSTQNGPNLVDVTRMPQSASFSVP